MTRRAPAADLETDLAREREARVSAEGNARNAVAAMRELTDTHAAAVKAAAADARADERRLVMAEVSGDVQTHLAAVTAAEAQSLALEMELSLWRAIGRITPPVRGDRISNAITVYRDRLETRDGCLVVRETGSPDVVTYLKESLERTQPEWIGKGANW